MSDPTTDQHTTPGLDPALLDDDARFAALVLDVLRLLDRYGIHAADDRARGRAVGTILVLVDVVEGRRR